MGLNLILPDDSEISDLSSRVGGLVTGTYSFPASTTSECEKTATQIATGQTVGYLPGDSEAYRDYIGRVTRVELQDGKGLADVSFPAKLFGQDMAGLLTILFGKISFYPGIKLESISADANYLSKLQGPRFGLDGIRRLAGKSGSKTPLLMAILKPGLGPSDVPLAEQFSQLVDGGTDLVKDDETRIDITLDDALRRLDCVKSAAKGRGIYVTHLTGPAFELRARAKKLQDNGAQAFLFCPYTYGLSLLQSLCHDPDIKIPVFAHPALTGPMTSGHSSIAPQVALATILRWSGCDAVLYPSPYGTIALPKSDAISVHRSLTKAEGPLRIAASVPSAGITPSLVSSIREDFGENVIINAGTGMVRSKGSVGEGAQEFIKEIVQHFAR
jgi:2,3-diketo-5-methylthiopentyl-1-phosphate enolase